MGDRRVILYLGNERRGRRLENGVTPEEWFILPAASAHQALGMYVTFWPDTIVLDAGADASAAEAAYGRLRSLEAPPALVLVGARETVGRWQPSVPSYVPILPPSATDADLIAAIRTVTEQALSELPEAI